MQPVEELPKGTAPVLCRVGLHASKRALDALDNAPGPFVSRVRLEGWIVAGDDKACATRRVRLAGPVDVTRELRLCACDCAERVLPIFEREHPADDRPRKAVEVARRFANGEATQEELAAAWAATRAAAGAAARDAAWAAAWDTAWDALRTTVVALQKSALKLLDQMIRVEESA